MKKFGVGFFVFFYTFSALANQYKRFSDLPKAKRQAWESHAQATVPVHFQNNMNCSAVFVGPQGEALTNLHCIEACLVEKAVTSTENIPGAPLSKISVNPALLPTTCPVQMEGKADSPVINAEILHVFGPGWLSSKEDANTFMNQAPLDYLQIVSLGFESYGDLVLIRLPVKNETCVRIAEGNFADIKPVDVVSLSYPIVYRKIDDNPMGQTLFVIGFTLMWSEGQASSNTSTLSGVLNPTLLSNMDIVASPGLIISSTDAEGGASGSPLFNKDGKLVAVTRSTWKGFVNEYQPWTSGAIDLSVHKKWIEAQVASTEKCL